MPFLLVLLHTYMDSLRTEAKDDGEERTINHHGKTINVASSDLSIRSSKIDVDDSPNRPAALVHRNEILELQVVG